MVHLCEGIRVKFHALLGWKRKDLGPELCEGKAPCGRLRIRLCS